jgi:ribose transport system ATP-binding protein
VHTVTPSALTVTDLSKTFAGELALDHASLEVRPAEVHALLGQNGSGKSTLVKILAGYHEPDPGAHATVNGSPFELGSPQAARAAGIRFVHQDLGLVDAISTVENLALGTGYASSRRGRIRWRAEAERARNAVVALGFDIDVRRPVRELSAAERAGVAIARALIEWESEVRLLVLDEPTAPLPVDDVDRLFMAVRKLRTRGLAVLFVSHHLDEIFEIADRVTVLRDGRNVATTAVADLNHDALSSLIVGRELSSTFVDAVPDEQSANGVPALRARNLRGGAVTDVSFSVERGEILGVAGLRGSGADELAGLVAGKRSRTGDVEVGGSLLEAGSPKAAQRAGVAFVPGDRLVDGIVKEMTVRENITLTGIGRHMRGIRLSRASERAEAEHWIEQLGIVTPGPEASILVLSGGNQQKVLLARVLRLEPRVLVLDDPTKGVDVGAKAEIHRLVKQVAASGAAVLVVSSDSEELVALCHRAVVLQDGRVGRVFSEAELNVEDIEHAQLGGIPAPLS